MRSTNIIALCLVAAINLATWHTPALAVNMKVQAGNILSADFADEKPSPEAPTELQVIGVRNGFYSAKLVVYADGPLNRPQVTVSNLTGPGGAVIPASAIAVRYALDYGVSVVPDGARFRSRGGYLGALAEQAPATVQGYLQPAARRGDQPVQHNPVLPIWLTINIPATAKPGAYTAQVTVTAAGARPATMPLKLEVINWQLPKLEEYRTWVEMVNSPDALAIQYGVELWSEKHWQLMERSLKHMASVGSRVLHVPLIARSSTGNEQSMVRWRKNASGGFSHDFTILERYLDTAERAFGGKPVMIVLAVWENYMIRTDAPSSSAAAAHQQERILEVLKREGALMGRGPAVTMVDAGGKLSTEYMAHYTEPAAKEQWQPLMQQLKERFVKRGLWNAAMLGLINDCWPTREEVQFFKDLAPELQWAMYCHFSSPTVYGLSEPGYRSQVWAIKQAESTSLMGWNRPEFITRYQRLNNFGHSPHVTWRYWAEYCITGDQRGMGRLGADYWPVQLDERARQRQQIWERYPESSWRNLGLYVALLAPAPEGPVASARLEMLREGLQEAEARIAIESALIDPDKAARLGEALVERCKQLLDERIVTMNQSNKGSGRPFFVWPFEEDWQQRSRTLYSLAAEVEAKLSGR